MVWKAALFAVTLVKAQDTKENLFAVTPANEAGDRDGDGNLIL